MMDSTPDTTPAHPEPVLSASAARRIKRIVADQPPGAMLRLEVVGGGCSGFSYRFGFAHETGPDDRIIERDGARAVIDLTSLEFLTGAEIDYVEEVIGASFKVHNPNATSGCGCGVSFSM
jgi:iron-sulfur cluster assembly accessory protein